MLIEDADKSPTTSSDEGDAIKVFIRVRPPMKDAYESDSKSCLEVDSSRNAIIMQCKPEPKVFTFDSVADVNSAQETIFNAVGKPIIEGCTNGYNGTIFAYGQTGSGKTFTMLGPAENTDNFQHELRGVIPRSFEYIFHIIKKEQEMHGDSVQFLCKCSFLEIYNEQVFDLLDPASTGLQLRENIRNGVFVDGLIEEAVTNASEAYQVLSSGWLNRTVASTSMNRESSRSHAVFSLHIESKEMVNGIWNMRSSQLNLVDLAGSERQKDTHTTGLRLKEAGSINKSLSALGNVIMALGDIAHGRTRHVPYRDSKLSFLLRDSLGGNAKTIIIACVHPGSRCFGETLSTLQFARRAKQIKNKAVVNEDIQGNVCHMQAEIRRLKEMLLKFQQGEILQEPSDNTDPQTRRSLSYGEGLPPADSHWKKNFVRAMFFREKAVVEFKDCQEQVKKLADLCERKDAALRQSRMVLKFRDEALKRLEKAHKDDTQLSADDKDVVIESLRGETKAFQMIVDNHPEVRKAQLQNEALRAELRRVRAQRGVLDVDDQYAAQLERDFRELQVETEGDKRTPSRGTPKAVDNKLVAATIERQRTQLGKFQAEIDTLKRQMTNERDESRRDLMGRTAELTGLRKTKEELEKTLKALQVRFQVERETKDEQHMETIKTMTTPKKARYQLRTRIVMGPGSAQVGGVDPAGGVAPGGPCSPTQWDMDGSYAEDNFLAGQDILDECSEEQVEGLVEELKKLQEQNRYLRAQQDTMEANIIKSVEDTSRIEAQKSQLEQLYGKDKALWADTVKALEERLEAANSEQAKAANSNQMLVEEVGDLRVMMAQCDRQIAELRGGSRQLKEAKEREIGTLETMAAQLQTNLEKLQKQMETCLEEQGHLKEREENLQETLNFQLEKLAETEEKYRTAQGLNQELTGKIQSLECRVEQEEERNKQLQNQIQQDGDKEEQLLAALAEVEERQNEARRAWDLLKTEQDERQRIQETLSKAQDEIRGAKALETQRMEAIGTLKSHLQTSRQTVSDLELRLEALEHQIQDGNAKLCQVEAANQSLEQELSDRIQGVEALKAEHEVEAQRKELEFQMLSEDFSSLEEHKTKLERDLEELAGAEEARNQLQTQLDQRTTELQQLTTEAKTLRSENDSMKSELKRLGEVSSQSVEVATREREAAMERESEIVACRNEISQLTHKREETERRLADLTEAFSTISDQLTRKRQEHDTLEEALASRQAGLAAVEAERQCLERALEALRVQFDMDATSWRESEDSLKESVARLRCEAEEAQLSARTAREEASRLRSMDEELRAEVQAANEKSAKQKEEVNRLREVVEQQQAERERMVEEAASLRHEGEAVVAERDALSLEMIELREENRKLTEIEKKFWDEMDANSKLAGHHNHKQRILYLEKMRVDKQALTQKSTTLQVEVARLKKKCEGLAQELAEYRKTGTPLKRLATTPLRERRGPGPQGRECRTPPTAGRTPGHGGPGPDLLKTVFEQDQDRDQKENNLAV